MNINEVAERIENIDLKSIVIKENPFFKKVDDEKLKNLVEGAFEGYYFENKNDIRFVKESFNKWDYAAKVNAYKSPEIRIYLGENNLKTEVISYNF